jgi:hypothetical protein
LQQDAELVSQIFQLALTPLKMNSIMGYRDRLKYWAPVRLLPTQNWAIVARLWRSKAVRFRCHPDAEERFQFLRRTTPHVEFKIVFEVMEERELVDHFNFNF